MQKLFIGFIGIVLLIMAASYALIPYSIFISKITYINASRHATNRFLADNNRWDDWWNNLGGEKKSAISGKNIFSYKNVEYKINSKTTDIISISVKYKKNLGIGIINIISLTKDSSAIQWKLKIQSGNNPVKKIKSYFFSRKMKNDIGEILESLKGILEKPANIYGINIHQEKVKDTLFISTKSSSGIYPSTKEVYSLIKKLKDYILLTGAKETNYPILHVRQDSGFFTTMVAIPIDRVIPQTKKFSIKRMFPGKILVTDVMGGTYSTGKAITQLDNYIRDNFLVSPAIPFESLITNREKETDTTKWITRIYYPIY